MLLGIPAPPERATVNQGESITLTCSYTGDPTPTLKWTRYLSAEFSDIPNTQGSNVLTINNAQLEDRGVYICTVENEVGSSRYVDPTCRVVRFRVLIVVHCTR